MSYNRLGSVLYDFIFVMSSATLPKNYYNHKISSEISTVASSNSIFRTPEIQHQYNSFYLFVSSLVYLLAPRPCVPEFKSQLEIQGFYHVFLNIIKASIASQFLQFRSSSIKSDYTGKTQTCIIAILVFKFIDKNPKTINGKTQTCITMTASNLT